MSRGLGPVQRKVLECLENEPDKCSYLVNIVWTIFGKSKNKAKWKLEYQSVYDAVERLKKRELVKTYKSSNKPLRLGYYWNNVTYYKWNLIVELKH